MMFLGFDELAFSSCIDLQMYNCMFTIAQYITFTLMQTSKHNLLYTEIIHTRWRLRNECKLTEIKSLNEYIHLLYIPTFMVYTTHVK